MAGAFATQVTNAITRQKKEQVVEVLKGKLEKSTVVFGLRFKGLDVSWQPARCSLGRGRGAERACNACAQVPTVQKFRKILPANTSVYVTKNSLMKVAVSQTKGWEALADKGCTVRATRARVPLCWPGCAWSSGCRGRVLEHTSYTGHGGIMLANCCLGRA